MKKYGISSIGVALPSSCMKLEELASLRGEDPNKYLQGLGCSEMSLCDSLEKEAIVELLTEAAQNALQSWDGKVEEIGMLVVGTETALDMSRPLSAWVAERLGIQGPVRSYEVKHACYGGTLGVRQAIEWKLSGNSRGRAALVIAGDIALYSPKHPGEPTQGAGAVAFIIDAPSIAEIDADSYSWSEPVFDFWRPIGDLFPQVDGKFSLECYKKAAQNCFEQLFDGNNPKEQVMNYDAICFHVPFPKMVKKAFFHLASVWGWDESFAEEVFAEKIDPNLSWNKRCGNSYNASLWISVLSALSHLKEGQRLIAFSYGSGFGSEILTLTAGAKAPLIEKTVEIDALFSRRRYLSGIEYEGYRNA